MKFYSVGMFALGVGFLLAGALGGAGTITAVAFKVQSGDALAGAGFIAGILVLLGTLLIRSSIERDKT